MHLIEFPEAKIKRYLPEDLSECDATQYIAICDLVFKYQFGKISKLDLLTHAVYKLLNMKPKSTEEIHNVVLLQELIENSFFTRINELDDGNYDLQINQNYINNPVEKFKPLWITYYGPSDGYQNMKFGEYTDALRLFLQFNQSHDFNLLYELAAVLYRPKKRFHWIKKRLSSYDGDIREPYSIHHLQERIDTFKKLPIGFIYGVYLYFASMQLFVSSASVPWGDKVLDLSILFKGDGKKVEIEASDIGLDSVAFAMAESGAFGNFEKVQNTSFWVIMIKMYDARINELKLKKQYDNAKDTNT
ncbi:hypothetical protein [Flavobacterium sp. HNIBRBA15423]|uniref:hypothetical protein n=1 Tax=Flavobacterium sp. HNIBRBA15423 TaxID=3458683 RepID=UPI004044BB55